MTGGPLPILPADPFGRTVGLVLAGGRSRRFGAEKALAALEGAPLVARAVAVLSGAATCVAVSAPEGSGAAAWAKAQRLPVLPDPPGAPDGPLSGVREGLRWARAQGAAVVVTAPCDAPDLPPDLASRLVVALGRASAAVARSPEGLQPLCAAWRLEALPMLEAALAEGRHPPVRAVLEALCAAEAAFEDAAAFANLNTRAELEARAGRGKAPQPNVERG